MSNKIDLEQYGIDEYREGNLRRLAALLATGVNENEVEFDMEIFSYTDDDSETVCGSGGCAVGWNTFLISKNELEGYATYSYKHIVGMSDGSAGAAWDWCFDYTWTDTDNTPQGAGKRIMWLLNSGLPEDSYEQMNGDAPLCYK